MTTESIRRFLPRGRVWSPMAMLLLVTAVVSGLLAMHVLNSSMGSHTTTHLADSAVAMGEPAPATLSPLVETHPAHGAYGTDAAMYAGPTHAEQIHVGLPHAGLTHGSPIPSENVASSKCSNGCVPVHSMGAMGCVLTLSTSGPLFAAAHPSPAPGLSTDRLPELGLPLALHTLRAPEPPDLNVLSISRT